MRSPVKPSLYLLVALALAARAGIASAQPDTDGSDNERGDLLALLDEQTAIATKTRLNADYVPGIVTVLLGEDLEARGVRTVWEALALVPGIDLTIDARGRRQLIIRGISDSIASGNVKIMLNDVAMNSSRDGQANPILNLPVEQLDRIEVIRGPGSAIHGEYAYAGVVNVVTRRDGERLYATAGSADSYGGGGIFSWHTPADRMRMSLNLASSRSKGSAAAGNDALYNTTPSLAAYSRAPGPANDTTATDSAVFNLGYRDFSLLAQWERDDAGDYFGINEILPPQRRIVSRNTLQSVNATQAFTPGSDWELDLNFGWSEWRQRNDQLYLGPAVALTGSAGPDVYMDSAYTEHRWQGGADLYWKGWQRQQVLLAAAYSESEVTDSWSRLNIPVSTTNIPVGTTRRVSSFTAQDEFRYSDGFTLTGGLRYDQYSDAGHRLTPRIAGVWRLDQHNIVKAQYGQAFRPPNFTELQFGGGALKPALIDTYELAYTYKGERYQSRLNGFYSELYDLIVFNGATSPARYVNSARARTQGIELQQQGELTRDLSADGNLTYVASRDGRSGREISGAAKWLGSVGLTARLAATTHLQLQYRYVGDRAREANDPRGALPDYSTVDATLTSSNFGYRGLTLRAGVKNLFAADVRYPALLTTDRSGNTIIGYRNDLAGAERTWWLQFSYRY